MKWGLKTNFLAVFMIVMVGLAIFAASLAWLGQGNAGGKQHDLNTFSSFEELQEFLNAEPKNYYEEDYTFFGLSTTLNQKDNTQLRQQGLKDVVLSYEGGSSDYSTTNIQVEGVDEGDIVKNDGKFAYIVSRNLTNVHIMNVYPPEDAKIISTVELNWSVSEIYLNGDRLVILGENWWDYKYDYYSRSANTMKTPVWIYNIASKSNPILSKFIELKGYYITSRMIGDYFYVIINQYAKAVKCESDLPAPPNKIHYISNTIDFNYYFTNITAINVHKEGLQITNMIILVGSSNHIYVSTKNIYIACVKSERRPVYSSRELRDYEYEEQTVILRIAINKDEIKFKASGTVTGRVLNRFSMDEYKDYFRIATTKGQVSRNGESTSENQVFVLNLDLYIVGQLTNIAPGERIYSARFMGKRCYLITFKKVDPFFVIDMSNPGKPQILGELKIPGYSNYLHPYGENHVIGIGKDTVEAEEGNFAWYQGVKISLFDVTNVKNPKELSKFIIGDRGTESDALSDPHAFLFSKEKNLLVIPIRLAEINESKYPGGASANTHGEFIWCGAYVFDISETQGIKLRGRITHMDGTETSEDDRYSYYGYYDNNIKRSFYIDEALFTVSDNLLKANDLNDLNEINAIELPS